MRLCDADEHLRRAQQTEGELRMTGEQVVLGLFNYLYAPSRTPLFSLVVFAFLVMPHWRITIEYTQIKACGHSESVLTQLHCVWNSYCSSGYLLLL